MDTSIPLDLIRYGHLFAMAIGLGAAFLADFVLLTRLKRGLTPEISQILHLTHPVIWGALGAMWLTGLILAAWRTGFDPSLVTPKLVAKILVVSLLTGNAVLIGRYALPRFAALGEMGLRGLSEVERRAAAVVAGVSAASWLLALAMGSSRFLAASPAWVFLLLLPLSYAAAIYAARQVMAEILGERRRVVRNAEAEDTGIPAPIRVRRYRLKDFPTAGRPRQKSPATAV